MAEKQLTRREFFKAGFLTAGTLVLTACGKLIIGGKELSAKEQIIEVGEDKIITSLTNLKENQAVSFNYAGKRSILVYSDGEIHAFENICTHRGGPTELKDNQLVCKWHGATFDPQTGKATKIPAPADSQLKIIPLSVVGDNIYVA